jgi:mannose-6-phosphate isomerase-like protein (cupin superfamily)
MTEIHPRDMSPEEREAYHQIAESQIQTFRYDKPVPNGRPKQNTWLIRRPTLQFVIQCVREGGENNLHYHTYSETAWMVLKGRARFVGVDEKVIAELGPMDGVLIPGGSRYKFLKLGDEDLEILQMVSVERREGDESERINVEAHREWMADAAHLTKY